MPMVEDQDKNSTHANFSTSEFRQQKFFFFFFYHKTYNFITAVVSFCIFYHFF